MKKNIKDIRQELSSASFDIPHSFSLKKRDYEMAKNSFSRVVVYLNGVIEWNMRKRTVASNHSELRDLLCMASFGHGLTVGLLEMKYKTYRDRSRTLQEIALDVKEFNDVNEKIKIYPQIPENHFRMGRGYGTLGLAKEGKKMLDHGTYWDNIRSYLKER